MMISAEGQGWLEANQRYLSSAINIVRNSLERYTTTIANLDRTAEPESKGKNSWNELEELASSMSDPPALERLCAIFSLSPFERDILLLCAGIELDSGFASLCAAAQGDKSKSYPTFSLALAALDNPHWSAIVPISALRRWRLIELGPGTMITLCPLRIDERILHYLAGVQHLDERLVGFVEPVGFVGDLAPSHFQLANKIVEAWSSSEVEYRYPIINLVGRDAITKRPISSAACGIEGMNLWLMSAQFIPLNADELGAFVRLWEREAALSGGVLMLEHDDMDPSDKARQAAISRLIENISSPIIVSSTDRISIRERSTIALHVEKPNANEQHWLWERHLEQLGENSKALIDSLSSQFDLSTEAIQAVCDQALQQEQQFHSDEDVENGIDYQEKQKEILRRRLWDACRDQSRPRLEDLAQRIEPRAEKKDLVLPEAQRRMLDDIAAHVRQRALVYERWGFASKSQRGLGISALFVGDSGTGKTMAAEVLAKELRLDLYRIDLSQVVSKYIGETEKNLKKVFDAAESGGAILLFDEADALFGKRSEVKDSHDRYANIEISYLLQRMEAYRGLAILTTNMKDAMDRSFLRRLRFVVEFPFPDAKMRADIWRRIFPEDTPAYGLDFNKLARLNLAGGNIRNIALYAAFLAADAGEGIGMNLLLRAARVEYAKLERPLTAAELGDWKWVEEA